MLKDKTKDKKVRDDRLRKRIRERVEGTPERPRLHVFKSNAYVYTQVINDREGAVLLTASTLEKEFRGKAKSTKNRDACALLGELLGKRLKEAKIEKVVFDRGTHPYHGRIKTLAEAIRKEGIQF
ncbi:MAG: 50S ribosomal protein L18 [Candidatus Aminicenantes bacterium]|nr:50S ribosomal protein L18 [Candidatus Aminicenantes bacterium]NLH75889.1 50S ribosomal protein L18 [Acidobacteriota bacterium]